MKYLLRNKVLLIIIIFILPLLPGVISLPQQNRLENIVTAIGVDKDSDGYELSIQYVMPTTQDSDKRLKISSSKGKSISEAMKIMNLNLGKTFGFAHCRSIIVNEEVCVENLTKVLDGFLRIKTNTNNIILMLTTSKAKELLETSENLDSDLYTILSTNTILNNKRHYQNFASVGDYYNSYFDKVKCIALNKINKKDTLQSKDNIDANKKGEEEKKDNLIDNKGELTILKNGIKLVSLNEEESDNLSWLNPKVKQKKLKITNFSDSFYDNTDIFFEIDNKMLNFKSYFENRKPIFEITLWVNMREIQVISNDIKIDNYNEEKNIFSNDLEMKIKQAILEKLNLAEKHFKTNKYDVIRCYETFYKFNNKEFKNYLNKLGQSEYFLDGITFKYNINIKQHL